MIPQWECTSLCVYSYCFCLVKGPPWVSSFGPLKVLHFEVHWKKGSGDSCPHPRCHLQYFSWPGEIYPIPVPGKFGQNKSRNLVIFLQRTSCKKGAQAWEFWHIFPHCFQFYIKISGPKIQGLQGFCTKFFKNLIYQFLKC